jgi:hypothetical protein
VAGDGEHLPGELVVMVLQDSDLTDVNWSCCRRLGGLNPRRAASASLKPPPRCGWCALRGRPCTMRW